MRQAKLGNFLLVMTWMAAATAAPSESAKTVLGPRNVYLADGADALSVGRGEEGVRLTLLGLQTAQGPREEKIGHANLCAGYLLVNQPDVALQHCNWVLDLDPMHWRTYNNRALVYLRLERFDEAEADIRKGQAIRPGSEKLKIVKGMYLDETQPVVPNIEVDERRSVDDPSDTTGQDDDAGN